MYTYLIKWDVCNVFQNNFLFLVLIIRIHKQAAVAKLKNLATSLKLQVNCLAFTWNVIYCKNNAVDTLEVTTLFIEQWLKIGST